MIGSDLSTVSKHLSVLKNAGILSDERNGNTIIYRLKTPCILNFIGCVEEVIKTNADDHRELSMCCRKTSSPPSSPTRSL
jgi:ArsR family transcriptional regulator